MLCDFCRTEVKQKDDKTLDLRPRGSHGISSLILPLLPYEDKREQQDIRCVGYNIRDFEAHVARFSEHAALYATAGLGDRRLRVFVYELGRASGWSRIFEMGG